MTAPNPARDAKPGNPFTDDRRGTWVLLAPSSGKLDWWFTSADGTVHGWRTQAEAEAAGLVPLYPVSPVRCTEEGPNGQCDQDARVDHWCTRKGNRLDPEEGDRFTEGVVAAPAPLDPGNPEHLRQVADFIDRRWPEAGIADSSELRDEAAAIDIDRAEAAQDVADRKRAEEIAREHLSHGVLTATVPMTRDNIFEAVLAGIRAGRAERQEAGQ